MTWGAGMVAVVHQLPLTLPLLRLLMLDQYMCRSGNVCEPYLQFYVFLIFVSLGHH
jgi:hypothetical protein